MLQHAAQSETPHAMNVRRFECNADAGSVATQFPPFYHTRPHAFVTLGLTQYASAVLGTPAQARLASGVDGHDPKTHREERFYGLLRARSSHLSPKMSECGFSFKCPPKRQMREKEVPVSL
jgi:hypothetical protein